MSIATPSLDALRDTLSDELKDIRLNLSSVLVGENIQPRQSLGVALAEMERSELVAEALGEHVFDYFLRNKRAEWEEYRSNVTPFELKKYLSL